MRRFAWPCISQWKRSSRSRYSKQGKGLSTDGKSAVHYDREQIFDWEDIEEDYDPDDPQDERWSYHPNRP